MNIKVDLLMLIAIVAAQVGVGLAAPTCQDCCDADKDPNGKGCCDGRGYVYVGVGGPACSATLCGACPASGADDPHFKFAHGGSADLRGQDNKCFFMLSHTNISLSTCFREAEYINDQNHTVHGTYMTAAFLTIITTTTKTLFVSYKAGEVEPHSAHISAKAGAQQTARNVELTSDNREMTDGNVHIAVKPATQGVAMMVTQLGRWAVEVSTAPYFDGIGDKKVKMHRVDVKAHPLSPSIEAGPVWPHGILGQSFDGDNLAVSGKKDDYNKSVVVTSAQAEGAIEGTWEDYIAPSPFSTDFKYSRFSVKVAPPRDVLKLTGKKSLGSTNNPNAAIWA